MPLFERIKDAVGAGGNDHTYNYHCRECLTKFESNAARIGNVECPNCAAAGSRNISRM